MDVIKVSVPFYMAEVEYVFNCKPEELQAYLKKQHGEGYKTCNQGTCENIFDVNDTDGMQFHVPGYSGENEVFYVWINEPSVNLLWHETMHLTFDILVDRGIKYFPDAEDAFAYLGGYIFEKLSEKLNIRFKIPK